MVSQVGLNKEELNALFLVTVQGLNHYRDKLEYLNQLNNDPERPIEWTDEAIEEAKKTIEIILLDGKSALGKIENVLTELEVPQKINRPNW
jgi:hypothetical protein